MLVRVSMGFIAPTRKDRNEKKKSEDGPAAVDSSGLASGPQSVEHTMCAYRVDVHTRPRGCGCGCAYEQGQTGY